MRWLRGGVVPGGRCRSRARMVWLAIASLVLPLAGCASWPGGETYGPGAIVDASQVETQDTLRPAPRLIASTRMTHTQAEALIARAITEHEIRRP